MMKRCGFSLPEVLVAASVMAVLFLPIMLMFLTSTQGVGQDVREVRATLMAQEIIEQVIAAHRNLCDFQPVPVENSVGGEEKELDLDDKIKKHEKQLGFPLAPCGCGLRSSRMYLSDPRPGFRRFLAISFERLGQQRGTFFTVPALFRVTARVQYTTPLVAGELAKDVKLYTFLAQEPAHCEEIEE